MSEGIRIELTPDALGSVPPGAHMVVVVDHDRPLRPALDGEGRIIPLEQTQPECSVCTRVGNGYRKHTTKAYHVQLEADGTAIVSAGVWAGLQASHRNPFQVVNVVGAPPPVTLLIPPVRLTAADPVPALSSSRKD